ncbi:MAG: hypothetical protein ACPGPG_06565, partial [Luminiphilus sp.]
IATDYIKAYAEQLREFIPGPLTVLGTDGFGRSDTRENLRQHFEVSRQYIVVAALKSLADMNVIAADKVLEAISALGIDADKANPRKA